MLYEKLFKGKLEVWKFMCYMKLWQALDYEQDRIPKIPIYYFFKFNSILNEKHKLTSAYGKWLDGLINNP